MEVNFGVNYLAVVVATIAAVLIGIVSFGVAGFGERLARLSGMRPRTGPPSPTQFAVGIVVGLVNAWVLALLALNLVARRSPTPSCLAPLSGSDSGRR